MTAPYSAMMTKLMVLIMFAAMTQGLRVWSNSRANSGSRLDAKAINLDTGKEYEIEPGRPMSLACVNTGLRLSFQCKAGNCGSCEFILDGKKVRSCVTKVPNKKEFKIKKKGGREGGIR